MNCPRCHSPNHKVLRTEPVEGALRRRRECCDCTNRFTTTECLGDLPKALVDARKHLALADAALKETI